MGRYTHQDPRRSRGKRSTLLDIFDVVQRYLPEYADVRHFVSFDRKMVIENMAAYYGVTKAEKVNDDRLFERLLNAA